jgi:hypothetical protein
MTGRLTAAILAEPLKSRSESKLLRAFTTLHQHLNECGLHPNLHVFNNECPQALKRLITKVGTTFQLAPP